MTGRILSQGGEAGTIARDFDGQLTIGRASGCDLVIAIPTVSSQHARIVYEAELGAFVLEDIGSTHGTSLDGTPVKGRETLGHLNVISLAGSVDLLFQDLSKCAERHGEVVAAASVRPSQPEASEEAARAQEESPAPSSPEARIKKEEAQKPAQAEEKAGSGTVIGSAAPPAPVPLDPAPPAPDSTVHAVAIPPSLMDSPATPPGGERTVVGAASGGPAMPGTAEPPAPPPSEKVVAVQQVRLVFATAINEIREYALKAGDNTVGRSVSNDISRVRAEISRSHAVISLRDGKIFVRDLGSSHGTTVNGTAITSEVEIRVGSTISFGIDDARLDAE